METDGKRIAIQKKDEKDQDKSRCDFTEIKSNVTAGIAVGEPIENEVIQVVDDIAIGENDDKGVSDRFLEESFDREEFYP